MYTSNTDDHYRIHLQSLGMLNDELELVKSLTSTLASFKEDPTVALGRQRSSEPPRDPDVWPPPTPQEPRYNQEYVVKEESIECQYSKC